MSACRTALWFCYCGLLVIPFSGWGFGADSPGFAEAQQNHWAFQPVRRPAVPAVTGAVPLENSIDAFVLAKLKEHQADLAAPADRSTLLRRVTLDLIGIPATPDEIQEFLADESPDAYERVIDRLLASPHCGETWGRMWLDVVRFAETAGFNADPARPLAFKFRDYAIRAFNRDLPFDRFLQEQIAGDELFPDDVEAIIATGYCRMWADESNASNIHLARQLALNDLTANVGAAVLGLSIGCSQCHDHKFDPLLQTDFYQLQAFFSGIVLEDRRPVGSHSQLAEYHRQRQDWLRQTADLRHELHTIERDARIRLAGDRRMKFPSDVLAAIDCLPEERTAMQRQLAFWSERQMDYKLDELPKHLSDEKKVRREELMKLLAEAAKSEPHPSDETTVMAVAELSTDPPRTHLLDSGSYDKPLNEVVPDYPTILRRLGSHKPPSFTPPSERTSGRRSELARWLTSADQPLTYRVWVNRLWQGHFGQGLVDNANDFGTQTATPTHQELLDWLVSELMAKGFHSKQLQRSIVLSATYRQGGMKVTSSTPGHLFAGFPRQRLSSERIRDSWLAASGSLNDTMFGPGVRPELPPNFGGAGNWKVSDVPERTRRSVYIYAKRNLPYPLLAAFDFPDMHESCGCRTKTTIAPQALMLLNSSLIVSAARQFAERAQREANSADPAARIDQAWIIAFGHLPTSKQRAAALKFLSDQQQVIVGGISARNDDDSAKKLNPEHEAFVDFCHALLNSNEFLFVE